MPNVKMLLHKGMIFRLNKGMRVYTQIPENVIRRSKPYSKKIIHKDIVIGRIYKNNPITRDEIIDTMTFFCEDLFRDLTNIKQEQIVSFIDSLNIDFNREESFDTCKFEGIYKVVRTTMDGGSNFRSHGYHVFCEKIDDPSIKVDFYQTGDYDAVIRYIEPILPEDGEEDVKQI